jgi:hypothetical protein
LIEFVYNAEIRFDPLINDLVGFELLLDETERDLTDDFKERDVSFESGGEALREVGCPQPNACDVNGLEAAVDGEGICKDHHAAFADVILGYV